MNRTYTGNPERETAPQTAVTPAPQAASLNLFAGLGGDVASEATGLQRATNGRRARARNTRRQRQRHEGNPQGQRVVAMACVDNEPLCR